MQPRQGKRLRGHRDRVRKREAERQRGSWLLGWSGSFGAFLVNGFACNVNL